MHFQNVCQQIPKCPNLSKILHLTSLHNVTTNFDSQTNVFVLLINAVRIIRVNTRKQRMKITIIYLTPQYTTHCSNINNTTSVMSLWE